MIFPVDCIKSAMQTDTIVKSQRKYTSIPVTAKVRALGLLEARWCGRSS